MPPRSATRTTSGDRKAVESGLGFVGPRTVCTTYSRPTHSAFGARSADGHGVLHISGGQFVLRNAAVGQPRKRELRDANDPAGRSFVRVTLAADLAAVPPSR